MYFLCIFRDFCTFVKKERGNGWSKKIVLCFELPCSSCWRALSLSEFLISAHLAHAQKINKYFALGQKLEREGMISN